MRPCSYCLLALALLGCCAGEEGDLLVRTLDALTRSLHYMQEKVAEINLDAVFCVRRVQEQLQAYLQFQPEVFRNVRHWLEVLRDKAKRVADEGSHFVTLDDSEYASRVGYMMNGSRKLAWYPSRETSVVYVDVAARCSSYFYDEDMEDICFVSISRGEDCAAVPHDCYTFNDQREYRDYGLTHEIIFWQDVENQNCVDSISTDRRMRLCSNVMRDANKTANDGFPPSHQDLFFEQVGLCGFWGFKDFNQPDWLENTLDWQDSSGCYKEPTMYSCYDELPKVSHQRVKRSEKKFRDGCYSHLTAVAMMALVVNVRFEAEKAHQRRNENTVGLNALLNGAQEYR